MSKKNWSNILSALARTALAFVFVFGQTAWAMQGPNVKDKPTSNAAAKSQQTPPNLSTPGSKAQSAGEQTVTGEDSSTKEDSHRGGQHEGIKVHGHWTIEVRNANGSLATHREFENSLQSSGGALLANVLAAGATAGAWVIHLDGSTNASSPCLPAPANTTLTQAGSTSCVIVPSQFASLAANFGAFGTLNVSASSSGTGQLVLNGTAVAAQNGAVGNVSTYLGLCGNTTPPSTCSQNIGNLLQFTAVTLSAAQVVQVSVGQTIAVTVNISFS